MTTAARLTFDLDMASMPTPKRAHFKPSWRGDRLAAINIVAKRPLGVDAVRAIDMNFQWGGGRAWNVHWKSPAMNNYRYVIDLHTGKVRRMTLAELGRPIHKWHDGAMRWRRGPHKGSARPHTYAEVAAYAKLKGVLVCAEIKSRAFGRQAAAEYLVKAARDAGHPPWFMALLHMRGARAKAMAIHNAGGQFALIFGRYRIVKPLDWPEWKKYVSAIWGPREWPHGS